jgi:hypothetical protein
MKILKNKWLHASAACLAATMYLVAPISINAAPAEVSANATGEVGYSMYVSDYTVTWSGNVEVPKVYHYADKYQYRGLLDLSKVTYDQKLNITTAVYEGYVHCFGSGCRPPF